MADVKFIIETLNKPPYDKNFTLISFDSLAQEDLFQILSDVLLEVNDQHKFDINADDFEQTITRILNALFILRYPPLMDTFSSSFRQNLLNGEKNTIFALLEWLLSNMDLLRRRAYLARFLMKIDIPSEILGDSDFAALYQQYTQLMEEFKKVHKESVLLKSGNKISISELRSDGVTMEKEKEIVANRIYQIRKKTEHLPNAAALLQSCHNLRLEMDRKKETAWQIQDEAMNTQQCQQRLYRLTQQLQELQKWSVGLSSQALLKKLEEEIYVTSYIVDQKLPRELSQQKKEKEVYENVARSSNVTKTSNELLMSKVQSISQEISRLLESKLMNSNSADDKTVLFRQQAAIIARKKDTLVEKFSKLKSELNDIRAKLEQRQQKLEETVGENGIILKDNEKFQEYVNKLRTRSAIYKRYRSDLAAVKAEGGVLSRTLDILRAKANQFGVDLENLKNYEVKDEDDMQTKSTDAIMALIIQISSNIAAQKAKLAPLLERVKPMQQKVNELLTLHEEKKRIYDRTSITLDTNLAKLVSEVNSLQEEHSKIVLETTLLASKIHIADVDLERAKLEFQASVDKNNSAPLIRDKLNMKIAESDKLNRLLKEEQKRVRENESQCLRQKTSWNVIQTLFELKIKGWQREKEEMSSLMHLEKGAETLLSLVNMARKLVQDDRELLQISQMELKKLQRQYRIMEGDRNSYAGEIRGFINKQRKIIDILGNEEKSLLLKLSTDRPVSAPELSCQWEKSYTELLKTYEKYLFLMKSKKDVISKLDKKIRALEGESKVISYYGDGKAVQIDANVGRTEKQVELLQNKLHHEMVKYDKALSENTATRQEVNALLKDRSKFNDDYKKLVMKMNSDKKKLMLLIEKATSACEQRDEADAKLKQAMSKEYQETVAQKHKMSELHRQLDHLRELKEFISIKGQKRILVDVERKQIEKKRETIANVESFISKHDRILAQIKEFCEEPNTDRLPALFMKQEEENFALFNYVNEINNEVENLQDEVQILIKSFEEQKYTSAFSGAERNESYDSLKTELEEKKQSVEQEKDEMSSTVRVLDAIFSEIRSIFSLLKGSSGTLINLFDIPEDVNISNSLDRTNIEDFLSFALSYLSH